MSASPSRRPSSLRSIPERASLRPADLFELAPETGGPAVLVGREAGFALKVLSPPPVGRAVPPGQGQVLVVLRGRASIHESADDLTKVVHTDRRDREAELPRGSLFRVANDARWTLGGEPGTVVLAVSTSVPRAEARQQDLLAAARRRRHMAPSQVWTNEMVRIEYVGARGVLPFRGWVPWQHQTPRVEFAIVLAGAFHARAGGFRGRLNEGSVLRVPGGLPRRFRAAGRGLCVGLVVSALVERHEADVPVDLEDARGFTPFARG